MFVSAATYTLTYYIMIQDSLILARIYLCRGDYRTLEVVVKVDFIWSY